MNKKQRQKIARELIKVAKNLVGFTVPKRVGSYVLQPIRDSEQKEADGGRGRTIGGEYVGKNDRYAYKWVKKNRKISGPDEVIINLNRSGMFWESGREEWDDSHVRRIRIIQNGANNFDVVPPDFNSVEQAVKWTIEQMSGATAGKDRLYYIIGAEVSGNKGKVTVMTPSGRRKSKVFALQHNVTNPLTGRKEKMTWFKVDRIWSAWNGKKPEDKNMVRFEGYKDWYEEEDYRTYEATYWLTVNLDQRTGKLSSKEDFFEDSYN
jgi:hypothetical protein